MEWENTSYLNPSAFFCSDKPLEFHTISIHINRHRREANKMAPPVNTSSTTSVRKGNENLKLRLETTYGDFRDNLARDGFAVVKGAVPRERADGYADKFYSYLEGL